LQELRIKSIVQLRKQLLFASFTYLLASTARRYMPNSSPIACLLQA